MTTTTGKHNGGPPWRTEKKSIKPKREPNKKSIHLEIETLLLIYLIEIEVCAGKVLSHVPSPTRARALAQGHSRPETFEIEARKVCAGKVLSHVPSPTRARIGVSSFTSRNLRDSGPQSVCPKSPKSCALELSKPRQYKKAVPRNVQTAVVLHIVSIWKYCYS